MIGFNYGEFAIIKTGLNELTTKCYRHSDKIAIFVPGQDM